MSIDAFKRHIPIIPFSIKFDKMSRSKIFFWGLILSVSFFSVECNDEIETPAVFVTPKGPYIDTAPGEFVEFDISLRSGDSDLRNLQITTKPQGGLTEIILDTLISGSKASVIFPYQVASSQQSSINMKFTVFDVDGDEGGAVRKLVISGNSLLSETTGHIIYSKYAEDANNAFNIDETAPLVLATNPDSSEVDIVNFDSTDDDVLSQAITSYSGIKFARNNSFNYPEASQQSAENSFESSSPVNLVSNLQIDDILVTRYDTVNNKYAVIRITDIVDTEGTNADKIQFNLKK